jgi:hypothetical protein
MLWKSWMLLFHYISSWAEDLLLSMLKHLAKPAFRTQRRACIGCCLTHLVLVNSTLIVSLLRISVGKQQQIIGSRIEGCIMVENEQNAYCRN